MAYIHAALMRQYADDAAEHDEPWMLWEFQSTSDGKWLQAGEHPSWDVTTKYRRKPRTIRIGEFDVPEPMRCAPKSGATYYIPDTSDINDFCSSLFWDGEEFDVGILRNGSAHHTKYAAQLHAIALISMTCTPERLAELKKLLQTGE